ncbi:MAG: DNA-formamidopyrimidine glycosylase family protein [Planctomycetota bacterium]
MPEGHVIHRIARDHRRDFAGQQLTVCSPQGRFAAGAECLDGRTLADVAAHGKHLVYDWDGVLLHVHLGLYGKFRRHRQPLPPPRGAVRLRIEGESLGFDLNGPTACELFTEEQFAELRGRLGPDPLDRNADAELACRRIRRSRAAIGKLLLDQSVIAGVGNVYRAEALFIERIDPERAGNSLSDGEVESLWQKLVDLMRIGVRHNRIITAPPAEVGKPPSRMNRKERLLVYKKTNCTACDGPVDRWDLGARTIYACRRCQT